jgi:hypothetical protein
VSGSKLDAKSLAADTASIVALARMAAKEAWEVEHHVHNGERWFGVAASPSGDETHKADRIGAGAAGAEAGPLVLDAGNDDWGAWTQIMGSTDTPTDGGSASHYDPHRIRVSTTEDTDQRYILQFAIQEDAPADDPGASDFYTELDVYIPSTIGNASAVQEPIDMLMYRKTTTTKMWARVRAPGANTSLFSFFMGIHEYTDPDQ